jgi:hypothetical protein
MPFGTQLVSRLPLRPDDRCLDRGPPPAATGPASLGPPPAAGFLEHERHSCSGEQESGEWRADPDRPVFTRHSPPATRHSMVRAVRVRSTEPYRSSDPFSCLSWFIEPPVRPTGIAEPTAGRRRRGGRRLRSSPESRIPDHSAVGDHPIASSRTVAPHGDDLGKQLHRNVVALTCRAQRLFHKPEKVGGAWRQYARLNASIVTQSPVPDVRAPFSALLLY